MAPWLERLDLDIRYAPVSPSEKLFRIAEARSYLSKIEAEVKLVIDLTDLAVSTQEGDPRTTVRPFSNATVPDVSVDQYQPTTATAGTIRGQHEPTTTATTESGGQHEPITATRPVVSSSPRPFRSLATWSPTVLDEGEWKIWDGEHYKLHANPVEAAQQIVKALAKVRFFVRRDCFVDDIHSMCPDIIPLAGGEAAIRKLLGPHVANLKNRSRGNAKKLWSSLKLKINSGTKISDLWDRNTANILFAHLSAAIDLHYISGAGSGSLSGRWAIFVFRDFCRNMKAGLDLDFLDGCPTRASTEGLEFPLLTDIPLTAPLIFATRASRSALLSLSSPSPAAFLPAVDDEEATPSISDVIRAARSIASTSDKRFKAGIVGRNPARAGVNSKALSPHLAKRAAC